MLFYTGLRKLRVCLLWHVQCDKRRGEPVWPYCKELQAGKQKDLGSNPLQLSFLFRNCGHCLVTLSLTTNETLKRLLSLPLFMQKSFWR